MGGILDGTELAAASKAYKALFLSRLAELPQLYKKLATIIDNPDSASTSLNWIADIPAMKEWLGDRQLEKLRAFNYTITHKDWEATIQVNKRDLSRDKMGLIRPRINAMAEAYEDHLQYFVNTLISGMFTGLCYDGQILCSSAHPLESGSTQANADTLPLTAANFGTTYAALFQLVSYKGVQVHQSMSGLLLLVGPTKLATAVTIVGAKGAGQALTGWEGAAEIVVCPSLTGAAANYWALVRPRFGIMPFIISREQGPESAEDIMFMRPRYLYGIDSSDNAGYGLYETIYGQTGAGK